MREKNDIQQLRILQSRIKSSTGRWLSRSRFRKVCCSVKNKLTDKITTEWLILKTRIVFFVWPLSVVRRLLYSKSSLRWLVMWLGLMSFVVPAQLVLDYDNASNKQQQALWGKPIVFIFWKQLSEQVHKCNLVDRVERVYDQDKLQNHVDIL